MRRYNFIQAPIMAFYSGHFYRDVLFHWKGTCFAYLAMLLMICWIPFFVQYQLSLNRSAGAEVAAFIDQIPRITITDGNVSVDADQPYRIMIPNTTTPLAVIDTTGKTAFPDAAGAPVLVTRHEILYKKSDFETQSFSLRNVRRFTLDRNRVAGWFEFFRRYSAIVFFPFAVSGSIAYRIVQTLVYALIGLLFVRVGKKTISYQELLRLSVMSVTPAIVVSTVLGVADIKIPYVYLLYFLSAMVYLFLAVTAAPSRQDGTEDNNRGNVAHPEITNP